MDEYLRSQWRQISPGAGDDFLTGPGGVDAMVGLVIRLQQSGFPVSMRDLLRSPTVPLLAAALRDQVAGAPGEYPPLAELWAESRSVWTAEVGTLVPLAAGRGLPLFFVHTGLGQVRFVEQAVDDFRRGRPVYGIESIGLRDRTRPPLSMVEIADQYVAQVRRVQPHGPYSIGGFCMGSHVAFEMAHRLTDAGEEVAVLALMPSAFSLDAGLNSIRPGIRQRPPGTGLSDLYLERLAYVQLMFGDLDLAANRSDVLDVFEQTFWLDGVKPEDFFWHAVVAAANAFAQENYDPRPYPGPALVFQTARTATGEAADWSPVAPNLRNHILDEPDSLAIMRTAEFSDAIAPATAPTAR
ncbi:thioesterase domain-containing protein [Herbidospora mongoliensis]|uniref:thioesterase domain-containing protein n=1 Tax=Herbidospora mongoliensis TaxID=688067 RepID=UPI00083362F1|nr:thioesterase domain-containing protein [Herbidospora mongoliensis]